MNNLLSKNFFPLQNHQNRLIRNVHENQTKKSSIYHHNSTESTWKIVCLVVGKTPFIRPKYSRNDGTCPTDVSYPCCCTLCSQSLCLGLLDVRAQFHAGTLRPMPHACTSFMLWDAALRQNHVFVFGADRKRRLDTLLFICFSSALR